MMKKIRIKNWNLIIDPEKTEEILKSLKSDAETCSCLYCKNYIATGLKAYDEDFLSVMKELGIDHKKDIHTSHIVELESGFHLYQIDYCFAGEIISKTPVNEMIDTNSFTYNITGNLNYRKKEFPGPALVLECYIQIPWILEEKP